MGQDIHKKDVIDIFRKNLVLCMVDHFGHSFCLKLI